MVTILKRLVTSYYNQTIANIYGTKVGIMFKYTNFITKHLVYKDKKTSHVIDIAHSQRLANIIEAFNPLTRIPKMCGAIDSLHVKLVEMLTLGLVLVYYWNRNDDHNAIL
jgi:hypothetical protein